MIDQLSFILLVSNQTENEVETSAECKADKRSVASEALVSLYRAEDIVSKKQYFGISDKPDIRIGDHKAGNHANAEFRNALLDRPNDFKFCIVCTFKVPNYCSKGNKSIAHAVEAFAMAFYNTLNDGYNRSYKFHHDFLDRSFWESILPPELQLLYRSADLNRLNENVKPYIKKPRNTESKKKHRDNDLVAKKLCRDRLLMYKAKDIKIAKYAKTLAKIDRSCYSRFMDGETALGVPRLLELISLVEEHLGLADRFDFEKEYLQAKHILESKRSEKSNQSFKIKRALPFLKHIILYPQSLSIMVAIFSTKA